MSPEGGGTPAMQGWNSFWSPIQICFWPLHWILSLFLKVFFWCFQVLAKNCIFSCPSSSIPTLQIHDSFIHCVEFRAFQGKLDKTYLPDPPDPPIPVIRVSDVVKWGEALSDTLGKLDSAHLARPVGGAAGARGGELTHQSEGSNLLN